MASFDWQKAAAIITSSPTPVLDVLGVSFGVPQCLLDFAKDVLNAFPSSVLNSFQAGLENGKELADSIFKDLIRKIFLDTGIIEYDSTLGRFVFVGSSSNTGVENDILQGLDNLFGLGTIIGFGAQAWVIGQNIQNQLDVIKSCLDQLGAYESLQKGPSALASKFANFTAVDPVTGETFTADATQLPTDAASLVYEANKGTLEQVTGFSQKCDQQLTAIAEIKQARILDPENNPEPAFNGSLVNSDPDSPYFGQTLSEALQEQGGDGPEGTTTFDVIDNMRLNPDTGEWELPSEYLDTMDPFVDVINASDLGAPVALDGQFLFSRTGIYYDSYGGGLDIPYGNLAGIVSAIYWDENGNPIRGAGVPENSMEYLFRYNPNIGGKGQCVSWHTYNEWADSVFDMDQIDESPLMQSYYDDDHFLQVILDQRNREIYDLSGYITGYQASGYGEDSALLINQRQILYSKISDHDYKIKRRKKQIQAHVVLSKVAPKKGQIPINSLNSLDSGAIAIERGKQEELMFRPNEVSGIVLPLNPTFIKSEIPRDAFTVDDIMVPSVGTGGIITSDPQGAGTSGTILALNDHICMDGLVTIYNFLDADLVTPDSKDYYVINCNTSAASDKPAQLVASSIQSTFPSGVGIPFFRGICNFFSGVDGDGNPKATKHASDEELLHSPYKPYGYARIQGGWNEVDSLFYASGGATIQGWLHVPDLDQDTGPGWNADKSMSSLHRVVLGCENRGGEFSSADPSWIVGPNYNSDCVRGLLVGFSRDRRITKGKGPSNNPTENTLSQGLVFHMSPTQSVNTSGVTFLAGASDDYACAQDEVGPSGYFGIAIDTSSEVSGIKFGDVSSAFKLFTITIDYGSDLVSLYLNNVLMKSQNIRRTFGTEKPPLLPSLVDASTSFAYDNIYERRFPVVAPYFPPNALGQRDFWYWEGPQAVGGPHTVPLTPWIIGGGYTDGMHANDLPDYEKGSTYGMNFMGGLWGGRKSGLYGYLGSFKLYNKALSSAEIAKNYEAQQGFFENIET